MRAVLRRPDFRLLFAGLVASMLGDSLLLLVLAIWVKELTGSAGAAGLTILFVVLPSVFAPVLGWAVDQVRRRPFLVWANLVSAATLAPLLAVHGRGQVWIIYVVALAYGTSFIMISGALAGLIKELLPETHLAEANGALQTVRQGMRLFAPLAGAAMYAAIGGAWVGVVDAGTYLVAACVIAVLRVPEAPVGHERMRWLTEASAGLRHLLREPALRRTTIATAIAMLAFGAIESVVFALVDQGLHRPATFVSVLVSVQGIGALAGGVAAAHVIRRLGEVGTVAVALGTLAVGFGLLAYPVLPVSLLAQLIGGVGLPLAIVGVNTILQRRTPGPLMGRVNAAADMLMTTPQAVSIALGAALVTVLDFRVVLAAIGVIVALAGAYLWPGRDLTPPAPRAAPEIDAAPAPVVG